MKPIPAMTKFELAAYVQTALEASGIHVVLSGGTAVSYYSEEQYVSHDLDLINVYFASRKSIQQVMQALGFREIGRYFTFPETQFFIEFPPGPLTVGIEPIQEILRVELPTGTLKVISVDDSVKDRLAAFFHWGDEQSLYQAKLIRKMNQVNIVEIERWASNEGKSQEFKRFLED